MTEPVKNSNKAMDAAFQSAFHAETGGAAKWQEVMTSYGAEGISAEIMQKLLEAEMKVNRGAYPVELRRVYEKIIMKDASGADAELKNAINSFDMEGKVVEYYNKIKPFSGLGDIFKNAS